MAKPNSSKNRSIWMNKDVLLKIKLKNGSYHGYLRPHNQQYYKTYVKYRSQSKKACRKAIDTYEKPISREVKTNTKPFLKICI